jgi:hypothetical protein
MEKLDQMFWIDQQKLKDITKQFKVELDLGLRKNNQNIVGYPALDALPDWLLIHLFTADEYHLGLGSTTRRREG